MRRKNARVDLVHHLRMLCGVGAGLQAIASKFCTLSRTLVDADAGFLIWFTPAGDPVGFYHETAPAELKDHFIANLDAMFLGNEEMSAWTLIASEGPLVGKMLDKALQQRFRQSNIYRHLCVPLDHDHLLDMVASVAGIGHALFGAWKKTGDPFTHDHAATLARIQPLMEQALGAVDAPTQWATISCGAPHLIVSGDGQRLLAIDAEAMSLLKDSHLLRQNFTMTRELNRVPGFVAPLLQQMQHGFVPAMTLPVKDGRLVCRASRTHVLNPATSEQGAVVITLEKQVAEDIARIDYVLTLPITPLQREIALFAMQGGSRQACRSRFDVSEEALKKHVRAVLQSTGARKWDDLVAARGNLGNGRKLEFQGFSTSFRN